MFLYLDIRILSRNMSTDFSTLYYYKIMELDYMFLYLEMLVLSRNLSTDFSSVIYVYYYGNKLHISLLGNSRIFYESFHRFP